MPFCLSLQTVMEVGSISRAKSSMRLSKEESDGGRSLDDRLGADSDPEVVSHL